MAEDVSEQSTIRSEPNGGSRVWGYRYLVCPPRYFDVRYSINPWMDPNETVDRELAHDQWTRLVATLREAGAKLDELEPLPDHPDAVFTANHGIVDGHTFWPARMRHPERAAEVAHAAHWFDRNNWSVADPAPDAVQEGAGDALPFAGTLVAGYGMRSDRLAYGELARRTGWPILPVRLTDPAFYHVDVAFCPLDDRSALIVPSAFSDEALRRLRRLVPDPVLLTDEEGLAFAANSVVVGHRIVMPHCSPRLGRLLDERGFDVAVCDVSEFRKAGGGCRCLTLALDTDLPTGHGSRPETDTLAGKGAAE
ncbi:N-dimethylarginine dimethylaminohydrolase [Nocardiopsis mwathae]|uniref:N-dimethylarginine dimethylaminohydrolase n=1 Tax=Nocardiopsis mwathae TaxID=1472723 RepID=A0A7W9YM79_9ACTN|nr:arginine deiminase-related protein [Nocardiopsis mwathae]MBB6174745.1 N-dimethylarginine dimethylaminohydrolase [Nocardiopsis mwathae]